MSATDTTAALVDALADVAAMLGAAGSFPHLPRERTDEILLELLRAGRVVRGHKRVWRIAVPAELVPAVRAAGGFLSEEEYFAARERTGGRVW